MDFRIADTFTDSLTPLTADEQKAVKTTAFDLQMDPSNPGMQFHRLDWVKDDNFWSVRVNRDVRIIVHRTSASLLLCYVGHHDDAYRWAERRKIERHPSPHRLTGSLLRRRIAARLLRCARSGSFARLAATPLSAASLRDPVRRCGQIGAAQLVEIRETVREIEIPQYVAPEEPPELLLFRGVAEEDLLSYGVPPGAPSYRFQRLPAVCRLEACAWEIWYLRLPRRSVH